MAARGNGAGNDPEREPLERLLALLGPRLDELRSLADEATSRWRGDRIRVGEGTRTRLQDLAREIGLVTRDEWDELELRVAQLEHRLRLLEDTPE
jgi:polyhydroxyalkanoate synthesis regulator phasin